MQWLMYVTDQVQKVSGHKGSLKAESFFVVFENTSAPIDYIDSVDILLVLGHAFKHCIRIVGAEWTSFYILVKW